MQRSTTILRSIRPTTILRGYATKADSTVTKGPTGPVLYTTKVVVEGARNGKVKGEGLDLGLTMSKALGGSGEANKSNPEQLFAGECKSGETVFQCSENLPNEARMPSFGPSETLPSEARMPSFERSE